MITSWKPQVLTYECGDDDWNDNALRFATREEALDWANDLMMRWTNARKVRAIVSDDPVNYRWTAERRLHRLTNEETT